MLRRRFNQNVIGEYMTLVASDGNTEFTVTKDMSATIQRFYYSIDGGKWTRVNFVENISASFNVAYGGNIRFKSDTFISLEVSKVRFTSNMPFSITGNIMSLGYFDDAKGKTSIGDNKYACLFESSLVRHVDTNFLPATTLEYNCYSRMFFGCANLTTAPELPATTLAYGCYWHMFDGTNVLPDCSNIDFTSNTVVGSGGLRGLFGGTKVTDNDLYNILPINPSTGKYWLPATTLKDSCYQNMFKGCSSLTTAPELPATTLASSCYSNMFRGCTSLKNAPELPATTLAISCYLYMFYGCSNLNYIKMLATNISDNSCLSSWVSGVASTGTFVKNKNATWNVTGVSGVPNGWTIQKV